MDYSKNNHQNNHRNKRKKRFQPSNRYFTVCVYTIITFVICLAIFKFTNNWAHTKALIGELVSVFSQWQHETINANQEKKHYIGKYKQPFTPSFLQVSSWHR